MSDKLGPVAFETGGSRWSWGTGMMTESQASESVAAAVDAEVSRIIAEALERAREVLTTERKTLDMLAEELIKVETLDREDFDKLLILNGIKPKVAPVEEVIAATTGETQ